MSRTTTFIEVYIDETNATDILAFTCDTKETGKRLDRVYKHLQRWMHLKDGRGITAIYQVDMPLIPARKWLKTVLGL